MKTVDTALKTMLDSDFTTLADFIKITRRDGTIVGFTNHDVSLTIDSISYSNKGGIEITKVESGIGKQISNLEVHGVLETGSVLESQIKSRYYDKAKIEVFTADYVTLPATLTDTSVIWISTGQIGNIKIDKEQWIFEVRSLKQVLKQKIGWVTSKSCRYDLFDKFCQKSPIGFKHTGTILSISGKEVTTDIVGFNSLLFSGGKLSVDSEGYNASVDNVSGSVVKLYQTVDATNLVGKLVTVTAACDKSLSVCFNTYANAINYGGEPHSPTSDEWRAGENTTTTSA